MSAQWQELQQKLVTAIAPARQWYVSREPGEQKMLQLCHLLLMELVY